MAVAMDNTLRAQTSSRLAVVYYLLWTCLLERTLQVHITYSVTVMAWLPRPCIIKLHGPTTRTRSPAPR
jgi:hypothetical protein